MRKLACLCAVLAIAACSTPSRDISALQVSPAQYQPYDCERLAAQSATLKSRTDELAARLDQAAANDKKLVVASLLFLPTLFAIGGTREEEAEYARLKGERAALQQASLQKGCRASQPGSVAFRG